MNEVNQVLADKRVIKVHQVHRVLTAYQVSQDHSDLQAHLALPERKVSLVYLAQAVNQAFQACQA